MKYLFIFISLFFFRTVVSANAIDSLRTDSDVYKFLIRTDPADMNYWGFRLKPFDSIYNSIYNRRIADSLHEKEWQKIDLNDDGQTDLLIYGSALLAVVNDNGKYKVFNLSDKFTVFYPDAIFFPVIKKKKQNTSVLLYYTIPKTNVVSSGSAIADKPNQNSHKLRYTELIYKYNSFIEANKNPASHIIQNVTFSLGGGMNAQHSRLSIDSSRKAIFSYGPMGPHPGTYYGIVDTALYNKIISIMNYINFPDLEDNYLNVFVKDCGTSHLQITYDNGKIKKIDDYCAQGTYGLMVLYDELVKIQDTQKWNKESAKPPAKNN